VKILGFLPFRLSYYRLAFVPKSALPLQHQGVHLNNERLEYLGDAVIGFIVADHLYSKFPEGNEGFMTKMRARIVKRKNLNYLAIKIDLPRMITSTGPEVHQSKYLYGNALEALMGAIYLDRGYGFARKFFIRRIMNKYIDLVQLVQKDPDHKSRIIEWAQKNRAEIIFESREEHHSSTIAPSFISTLLIEGKKKGTGRGGSKKEAEQQAAKQALSSIHSL
jgi:ribonuclease-3